MCVCVYENVFYFMNFKCNYMKSHDSVTLHLLTLYLLNKKVILNTK